MIDRVGLSRTALKAAIRVRRKCRLSSSQPICVYDVAEEVGIPVFFVDAPSLEGMYSDDRHAILVSSHRWPGRQAFNCAHELGHERFGHGTRVDEYLAKEASGNSVQRPEEWLVDRFAGHLLMPKAGVETAFASRSWSTRNPTPRQAFIASNLFGVGYATLVNQMQWSHGLLNSEVSQKLLRTSPKDIRADILDGQPSKNLVVVDNQWAGRSADIQVGDPIILPARSTIDGDEIRALGDCSLGLVAMGEKQGVCRVHLPDEHWAVFVRVTRNGYVGLSRWRHMENPDER